jgi:ribosome recycling factor
MHQLIKDANNRMDKTLEALRSELAKVRTGKATTALLDGVKVDYYGTLTPVKSGCKCYCTRSAYFINYTLG